MCFRSYDFGLSETAYASKRSVAVCSANGHLNRRFSVEYDIQKVCILPVIISFLRLCGHNFHVRKTTKRIHLSCIVWRSLENKILLFII